MSYRAILLIFLSMAMASIAIGPAAAQTPVDPHGRGSIVLFGASWCAPCRDEYRELPKLVAAAAPDRLIVAWIDRRPALPAAIPAEAIEQIAPKDAQSWAIRLAGEGYGLPFTAMLDEHGEPCALWRKPLRPDNIAALRANCHH